MTTISSYVAQVKPGRFQDASELLRRAAKPLESRGAHDVRVLRSNTGETYGGLVMSMEFENNEAYGTWYDKVMADDEIVAMIGQAESADSPYLNQMVSIGQEIPIEGPKEHGPVVQVSITRPLPGRAPEAINLGSRGAQVLGRHGARGCRLLWISSGGLQSGAFVFVTEFASTAAMGKAGDALMSDPEGLAFLTEVGGAGSPATMLSTDIYYEIPL
jgi:hypothetical protein